MSDLQTLYSAVDRAFALIQALDRTMLSIAGALETMAEDEAVIHPEDCAAQDAGLAQMVAKQEELEAHISQLVIDLDSATTAFGSAIALMKRYTLRERMVSLLWRHRAQRMRSARVRAFSIGETGQGLLILSDRLIGALRAHMGQLELLFSRAEKQLIALIERRSQLMVKINAVQDELKQLVVRRERAARKLAVNGADAAPAALCAENQLLLVQEKQALTEDAALYGECQLIEMALALFQRFVDGLNSQISAQHVLVTKLGIDTERRIVLFRALEDSRLTEAQQAVAEKISRMSRAARAGAPVKTGDHDDAGADEFSHICDLLDLHRKQMLAAGQIERRKMQADEAFAARFQPLSKAKGRRKSGPAQAQAATGA